MCTNGSMDRFKLRHVTFGKVSGEAKSVNNETQDRLTTLWSIVRNGMPIVTSLHLHLAKLQNPQRKNVLVAYLKIESQFSFVLMQMELKKLFWKSKNQRCFRNVKNIPVRCSAKKKSWMTFELFETWNSGQKGPIAC